MGAAEQAGKCCGRGKHGGHGKAHAGRIFPWPVNQITHQLDADIIEHERGNNFIESETQFEHAGEKTPQAARKGGTEHHGGQHEPYRGARRQKQDCGRCAHTAQGELPFGSDVPYFHAERDGYTDGAKKERNGLEQCVFKRIRPAESPLKQEHEGRPGGLVLDKQEHGTDEKGKGQRREQDGN